MSANATPTLPDKTPGGYVVAGSLQTLCDGVATALQAHPLIAAKGIRVLPEYAGDLINSLNQILNSKLSILMVVALEGVDSQARGMTRSYKDIGLQVLCYENVLINQAASGSRVAALTLAEMASGFLHCHADFDPALMMTEKESIGLDKERSQPGKGLLCYHARFTTSGCPTYEFTL